MKKKEEEEEKVPTNSILRKNKFMHKLLQPYFINSCVVIFTEAQNSVRVLFTFAAKNLPSITAIPVTLTH
jgi:hypothetical protein